jgi:hypothetical protein
MNNQNFIHPFSYFELNGHLGGKSGSPDTNLEEELNQIKPNLAGMAPGCVPFKKVSDSPDLHSRWLLLLKPFSYFELDGHLGWKSGSPDTNLEGDHPRIISAKFG